MKKPKEVVIYNSFAEWKDRNFPQLVKDDEYQRLQIDASKLAVKLANESVEKLLEKGKRT